MPSNSLLSQSGRQPLRKLSTTNIAHLCFNTLIAVEPHMSLALLDDALSHMDGSRFPREQHKLVRALLHKKHGLAAFARGNYESARGHYLKGVREILGPGVALPSPDAREPYRNLSTEEFLDLVALADNISLTYSRENNILQALQWLEEVEVLFKGSSLAAQPDKFDWMDNYFQAEEYYTIGINARSRASAIFEALHNTASALALAVRGSHLGTNKEFELPQEVTSLTQRILEQCVPLLQLRHPDPSLSDVIHDIIEPTLQIRGSWQKHRVAKKIASRSGACVFIWKSRLYVFGGQTTPLTWFDDLQYLDLTETPLKRWHSLPKLPARSRWKDSDPLRLHLNRWNMVVHDDCAWLFVGSKELAKFDLVAETWSIVETKYPGAWPYQTKCEAYAMTIHKGVIYVFGGEDTERSYGTDIFMALDLKTLRWKKLSGTSDPVVKSSSPGLRTNAQGWVDPASEKLYVLYGAAVRQAAWGVPSVYSKESDYTYTDMWSYHIPTSTWREERLHGNIPCARTEFSSTYNAVLNKTFVFGGYNGSFLAMHRRAGTYMFSYFADTFMWTPETNTWSQVMTRGFPTARAQSTLVSDPDTGRVYLFGGYSNSDFVEGKQNRARFYSDVWQLCVDLPGGDLDKVNLEDEARMASMGADKRCFGCGEIGHFSRCGGSCRGAVFFCSRDCQVDSWREHKQMHGCQKR